MLDRTILYNILYALAARNGRDKVLFGGCHPLSQEAFERSLACDAFPEIWFELPLAGEPWFDLHALTARADLKPGMTFAPPRSTAPRIPLSLSRIALNRPSSTSNAPRT